MVKERIFFVTARLQIRKIKSSDAGAYYDIFGAEDVAAYDDFDPISVNDAFSDVEMLEARGEDEIQTEWEYAVCEKESDEMIGALFAKFEEEKVYIGYHFNAIYRGKGFARESVVGWIRYLKRELSECKICAKVDSENQRSIRLLEQIGFTRNHLYEEIQFFKNAHHKEWLFELIEPEES